MKKHLGSWIFLLLFHTLHASTLYDVQMQVSNHTPFVKEAVDIAITLTQKDKSHIMYFELKTEKNDAYLLVFRGQEILKNLSHDKQVRYNYQLYPLQAKPLDIVFALNINLVTEGDLDKFISGNRNVIKPLNSQKHHDTLTPLHFDVQALEHNVTLIGDFTLNFDKDKTKLNAFEQLNIHYTLKGEGYNPHLKDILPDIPNVERFIEIQSTANSQSFRYALLAQKDFTIPEVSIPCFSPTQKRYYTLSVPSQKVAVTPLDTSGLVDATNSLPEAGFEPQNLLPYLNGLLLFLAGFFTAFLKPWRFFKKQPTEAHPYHDKVLACKDEKTLLRLLLSLDNPRHKEAITQLEQALYHDKKVNLKALKERLSNR